MKILVLSPFGATEPYTEENIGKVAREDVSFEVDCLKDVFPLPYNTYRYNLMECVDGAVERIIKAEKEGFDAVVIPACTIPGFLRPEKL